MASNFFALFSRMKNINRWALMRNTREESLSQHSFDTAAVAHALAVIGNRRLGKSYNAERAALLGLYHDMPEILTGDMPTPVKYYNSGIRKCFSEIETAAQESIINTLPEYMRTDYAPLLTQERENGLKKLVKAADKISALIKCTEERQSGNMEFSAAEKSTAEAIKALGCPEADIFIEEFLGGFSLVLDSVLTPPEKG